MAPKRTRPILKIPDPKSEPPRPRSRSRRGISASAYIIFALLLVLPVYALSRLTVWIDWRLLVAEPLALSVFTFFMYRSDKQSAVDGEWRIPESMLHFTELIGGWPGAFLAQRIVRHKISKTSYQIVFWAIVLIHQFIALDFVMGWRLTHGALHFFKTQSA